MDTIRITARNFSWDLVFDLRNSFLKTITGIADIELVISPNRLTNSWGLLPPRLEVKPITPISYPQALGKVIIACTCFTDTQYEIPQTGLPHNHTDDTDVGVYNNLFKLPRGLLLTYDYAWRATTSSEVINRPRMNSDYNSVIPIIWSPELLALHSPNDQIKTVYVGWKRVRNPRKKKPIECHVFNPADNDTRFLHIERPLEEITPDSLRLVDEAAKSVAKSLSFLFQP